MSDSPFRPESDIQDSSTWRAYWKTLDQPWRTEPEIDTERQKYLAQRRATMPDIENNIYPFKDIALSRADIEWLLATYNDDYGSQSQSNKYQQEHSGLDLRGADLRGVDLRLLPLTGMKGGLDANVRLIFSTKHRGHDTAGVHLEGADLSGAHLEGANLSGVHLEAVYLRGTHLEGAYLRRAHLEGAYLVNTHLEGTNLSGAHLEGAILENAHLEGTETISSKLKELHMQEGDSLMRLPPANLQQVFFSNTTSLENATLGDEKHGFVSLVDISWGGVNLSVIDWNLLKSVGEESEIHREVRNGQIKNKSMKLSDYSKAVRANRQLAIELQGQGLNEVAIHFAYRAQKLQRAVFRVQRNLRQYLFSLFLDLLVGYGYKPERSLIAYLITIFGFMGLYLLNSHFATPHLSWDEALVLSLSSFHGRGFFAQNIPLGNTYARLAVVEAIIGLLIEVSLIAAFTQRFLGKVQKEPNGLDSV